MTKCYSDHNEDIRTKGSCDYCGGTESEERTSTTHTPAPWKVDWIADDPTVYTDYGPIASVVTEEDGTCEADARLIAAAPDLLAAAKDALSLLQELDAYEQTRESDELVIGNLVVAINKALGR